MACEVAYFLSRQGLKVTVIGDAEKIGSGLDPGTATVLMEQLKQRGVQFYTGFNVRGIQEKRVLYQDRQGHGFVIEADVFVVAESGQPTTELADELEGVGLNVYHLPFCSQPGYVIRAVRIGASIARQI